MPCITSLLTPTAPSLLLSIFLPCYLLAPAPQTFCLSSSSSKAPACHQADTNQTRGIQSSLSTELAEEKIEPGKKAVKNRVMEQKKAQQRQKKVICKSN